MATKLNDMILINNIIANHVYEHDTVGENMIQWLIGCHLLERENLFPNVI
jgi:hypothetical protein